MSKFGLREISTFLVALFFGTGLVICSKAILSMPISNSTSDGSGGGDDHDNESSTTTFQKPLLLTFGMFFASLPGLPLHWLVLAFRIPFPGYDFDVGSEEVDDVCKDDAIEEGIKKVVTLHEDATVGTKRRNNVLMPMWMYFYLAIPAIFDFGATVFCMVGLQYLDASVSQMLRGSVLVFVALMKQRVLKDQLYKFHWVGVFWIVMSVTFVSAATLLLSVSSSSFEDGEGSSSHHVTTSLIVLGLCQIMFGTFLQACHFVSEEHMMRMSIPVPPLLLVGMEGFWGTVLCICVMFPVGYYLPGSDNGSYEDPFHTWDVFVHSRNIQMVFGIYLFFAFFYYLFAILVTFMQCSVWNALLDTFRPITVLVTELFIFYCVSPLIGEMWTKYSYLQIAGMAGLIYGTAIYNAPNGGSLRLEGQWWALGINLSKEYDEIRREHEVKPKRTNSSVNLLEPTLKPMT